MWNDPNHRWFYGLLYGKSVEVLNLLTAGHWSQKIQNNKTFFHFKIKVKVEITFTYWKWKWSTSFKYAIQNNYF